MAGVDVTSTSGAPGASTSIVIRGVSSISSTNQPLMIVDGLPIDNKTTNTGNLASDSPTSALAFSNRNVDFTNRAADINPEDIESLTVLKGPEASALYGIDAANGAIVITTKRGRNGTGGFDYSNSFRIEQVRAKPDIQSVYGPSGTLSIAGRFGCTSALRIPRGRRSTTTSATSSRRADAASQPVVQRRRATTALLSHLRDVDGRSASSRTRAEQGQPDRIVAGPGDSVAAGRLVDELHLRQQRQGVQGRQQSAHWSVGLAGHEQRRGLAHAGRHARAHHGPLGGDRNRQPVLRGQQEQEQPRRTASSRTRGSRSRRSRGATSRPTSVPTPTRARTDAAPSRERDERPTNGILDVNDDVTRNINAQTLFQVKRQLAKGLRSAASSATPCSTRNPRSTAPRAPISSTRISSRLTTRGTIVAQGHLAAPPRERVRPGDGRLQQLSVRDGDRPERLDVDDSGRRELVLLPVGLASFIFTDAFPSLQQFMTRQAARRVRRGRRDAPPYSYRTTLEAKTTSYGGYGYGFTGPNPNLQPEFANSCEFGTELSFLNDRLGVDATVYHKKTQNQIVQNIRGSYATGFVLFNLNGATTENGAPSSRCACTPIQRRDNSWDILANFEKSQGKRSRCRTLARSRTSRTRGCTATCATARCPVCRRCR